MPCEFDVAVEGLYRGLVEIINSLQLHALIVCQPLSTFLQLYIM